mgnify:CR=1 FL=1
MPPDQDDPSGDPGERPPSGPQPRRSPRPRRRSRLIQTIAIGAIVALLTVAGWFAITSHPRDALPGIPRDAQNVVIGQWLASVNTELAAGQHVQVVVYPDRVVASSGSSRAVWAYKYDSSSIWELLPRDRVLSGQLTVDERRTIPASGAGRVAAASGAILSILMLLGLGGFLAFFTWYMAKSMPKTGVRARTRAVRPARFADVAGLTAVRDDLDEVVRFLRQPDAFTRMGARCPRGILLVGPPGTGKTLLARAVAGEAKAAFQAVSGSDFVEMFVGMGARRVRELFAEARKRTPAIIFIDEIDAVGRRRSGQSGGGNNEYEQTINQLLTEMDGFSSSESVVVIAATNRMDVLDPALLRPGRFDRHIFVDLPDRDAREQILAVHARGKQFAPGASLAGLARETSGMSGADLENVLNEAALSAVRLNHNTITRDDLTHALERVAMGMATQRRLNDEERRRVAIHELGHAFVAAEYPVLGRVEKVSVISRGPAGGFTRVSSDDDRRLFTRSLLEARLAFALGGMAAEALYCAEISSGANNDLQQATRTATAMVCEFGMSDLIGPVHLEQNAEHPQSEEVRREVRQLTGAALLRARAILRSYAPDFTAMVDQLLVEEVWDAERFVAIAGVASRLPVVAPATRRQLPRRPADSRVEPLRKRPPRRPARPALTSPES